MPKEARNFSDVTTVDTTGLDHVFSCHDKTGQEDLTLEEAARRLNLCKRTVQRHLNEGLLKGYKVSGPRGPEWRINLESWQDTPEKLNTSCEDMTVVDVGSTEDTTSARQDVTAPESLSLVAFYERQVERLEEKLEAATYRNGYLEAQITGFQEQIKLLPDLSGKAARTELLEQQVAQLQQELKSGWWSRFLGYMTRDI